MTKAKGKIIFREQKEMLMTQEENQESIGPTRLRATLLMNTVHLGSLLLKAKQSGRQWQAIGTSDSSGILNAQT